MTTQRTSSSNTIHDLQHLLPSGDAISNELAILILEQIDRRIPTLPEGISLTAKNICGRGYWEAFSPREQRLAGQYISMAVTQELLPFIHAGTNTQNAKLYVLDLSKTTSVIRTAIATHRQYNTHMEATS